jgi:hypothetical protein
MPFASPAEVAAQTPPERDRAIDVIRIAALTGVVLGHTVMATSMIRDDVFSWGNLLTSAVVFQALTWVFQIKPLFFFAGTAASIQSWPPGTSWGGWLMKRCTRLFRPVFYYPSTLNTDAPTFVAERRRTGPYGWHRWWPTGKGLPPVRLTPGL